MIEKLSELAGALARLMRRETAVLSTGQSEGLAEISAAKQRLAASLKQHLAELDRENAGWHASLPDDEGRTLASEMSELAEAATANGAVLERQIDLSRELLAAIGAEARRLAGTTRETYGASGSVMRRDVPAPFAVKARL